jgi:hypothetical protein
MKPALLILELLRGVFINESAEPQPTADFVFWARAHTLECTNATDGSISSISHSVCADGWGVTWDLAVYAATANLAQFTCLGPQWGCCMYTVDSDFNVCGK